MLTSLPSGRRYVLVDAATLPERWSGWQLAADGHVLAPHDVVRRADGHDVVLDVCVGPFSPFLARRLERGDPLSPGESVTAGVSLLRGCGELIAARGDDAFTLTGDWWLTAEGKPVFAAGSGSRTLRETTSGLLSDLSVASARAHAWQEAISAVGAHRPSHPAWQRAEEALFEIAVPLPLDTAERARSATPVRATVTSSGWEADEVSSPIWATLGRYVDADVTELVSRTVRDVGRRWREVMARRRAPLVWGAVATVAVVVLGMAWPAGGGSTPDSTASTPSATASPTEPRPTPAGSPGASGGESGDQELTVIAAELLDAVIACGDDDACASGFAASPDVAAKFDAVAVSPERRSVVLLDDFGGVAVFRVGRTDREAPDHLLVIASENDRWLLRDITEVAQQP